jgi:hypothetical protein
VKGLLILILLLLISSTSVLAGDAGASKGFEPSISMTLIAMELSSMNPLEVAIPDDAPDETTYIVTAKQLRALYTKIKDANRIAEYYDADEIELKSYRENWPIMNKNLTAALNMLPSLQTAVSIWQGATALTVLIGTIAYLTK